MRKAMLAAIGTGLLAIHPILAQQKDPQNTAYKGGGDEGITGGVKAFFRDLDWWVYVLVVLLIILVGVFFYLRKQGEEE